jgi:hypothetical protein
LAIKNREISGGVTSGGLINTFDPGTNRISNLPCTPPAGIAQYDSAGNQQRDDNNLLGIPEHQFALQ